MTKWSDRIDETEDSSCVSPHRQSTHQQARWDDPTSTPSTETYTGNQGWPWHWTRRNHRFHDFEKNLINPKDDPIIDAAENGRYFAYISACWSSPSFGYHAYPSSRRLKVSDRFEIGSGTAIPSRRFTIRITNTPTPIRNWQPVDHWTYMSLPV